ncbi:MAG: OsmC family protein [Saprospiraceae bacterium]|nr:OsmC family protein [Saprospiraceae bacterium]
MRTKKVSFINRNGYTLSARLELPADRHPHNFAIFAHVFTGSKSLSATRHISRSLTLHGFGVLRFDFTGLGESEGDFADTTFTSNVDDLLAAAEFLDEHYKAPALIVGHSLGGAASIFAGAKLDTVKAVATIGTPSEPEHVSHLLESSKEEIEQKGEAQVSVGGRKFTIKKQFLDDLESKNMFSVLQKMRKALLVLHSPQDSVVSIENASRLFNAAFHPKSFVTLDGADHMLTNKKDAVYAGNLIASWADRYVQIPELKNLDTEHQVVVRLGANGYTTGIKAGKHGLIADEPLSVGGDDFGPSPYELLSASLGACTAMTLQMYARRKGWDLREVEVHLSHGKKYMDDCSDCEKPNSKIDHFLRLIEFEGDLTRDQITRLLEIADRCPVHKTLHNPTRVETQILDVITP